MCCCYIYIPYKKNIRFFFACLNCLLVFRFTNYNNHNMNIEYEYSLLFASVIFSLCAIFNILYIQIHKIILFYLYHQHENGWICHSRKYTVSPYEQTNQKSIIPCAYTFRKVFCFLLVFWFSMVFCLLLEIELHSAILTLYDKIKLSNVDGEHRS